MSLINDLIRRARERPTELTIRPKQVSALAELCHSLSNHAVLPPPRPRSAIEEDIRAGRMRWMDIPVRVLGADAG